MKYVSRAVLVVGLIVLLQGAVAFFLRFNFITGTIYGPSLMPIYIVFTGIGILVLWLALRTIVQSTGTSRKERACDYNTRER